MMLPRCQDNLTERHSDFSESILLIFDKIRSYYQYVLTDSMELNENEHRNKSVLHSILIPKQGC